MVTAIILCPANTYVDFYLYGSKQELHKMFKQDAHIKTDNKGFFIGWILAKVEVHCPMNFERYPRDYHTCPFQIISTNFGQESH
jgi:hypothetical protein